MEYIRVDKFDDALNEFIQKIEQMEDNEEYELESDFLYWLPDGVCYAFLIFNGNTEQGTLEWTYNGNTDYGSGLLDVYDPKENINESVDSMIEEIGEGA